MKYSKIPLTTFSLWKKKNRDLSYYSKIIYLYLFSSSLTSMSGIFELPDFRKTGLEDSLIDKGLIELYDKGLIVVDEENEMIAVFEMIKINRPAGIKQITGIIKNYNDIEEFNHWIMVLGYMAEIDYDSTIMDYIKSNKIYSKHSIITQPNTELTQEEKDEEIKRVEEMLNQKRAENNDEKESKVVEEDINKKMKASKEVYNFYTKHSEKPTNDSIEREALESIYELLNNNTKEIVKNAISRYINTISDVKFTQGIVKFFDKKEGYLTSFLKDTNKGMTKAKNSVQCSSSDSDKVVSKDYDIPEEIKTINSIAIKEIYVNKLGSEFLEFTRERTNIDFNDEDFIRLMIDKLMSIDRLAFKFLEIKGIFI